MRPLFAALAALTLLGACAEEPLPGQTGTGPGASPRPGATPGGGPVVGLTPAPRPSSPVTIDNLSGQWVFGERNEPAAGPIVDCSAGQILTINDQSGELSGGVARCAGPCTLIKTFTGDRKAGAVTLTGSFKGNLEPAPTRVTYTLTYNPQTQHLVGTRAGVSFWAAPLVQPDDGSCEGRVY
jgi:hypothetical protein